MSVIYILAVRQVKRYFRNKARIFGSVGQSLLYLVSLGFGLNPIFEAAGEGNYLTFLVPGVIAMSILFTAVFNGAEVIWDRQFGFLKETLVAPVERYKIMLGKSLGGAVVATLQGVLTLVFAILIGFQPKNISSVFLSLPIMFLIALAFTALGIAIASNLDDMQGFQLIMNFMIMPLFFLSGALFPIKNLNEILSTIVKFNPVTYGVDALRGVLVMQNQFSIVSDISIILFISILITLIGSKMFSKIQI